MKIIIIAAGSSTRLSKEILDIPKGLSKINSKSIIEIQLDLFKKNQLSDITIIVGPNMVIVKIKKGGVISKRINIEPTKIKNRFMVSLKK